MDAARTAIEELVHRETRAWDTQDVELLLSILHPDMVWPWPPHPTAHDPLEWVLVWGRYDRERWRRCWQGRACKLYTRLAGGDWRMIAQTGLLDYEGLTTQ